MVFPTALPNDSNSLQDSIGGLLDLAHCPVAHTQPYPDHPGTVPLPLDDSTTRDEDNQLIVNDAMIPQNPPTSITDEHVSEADDGLYGILAAHGNGNDRRNAMLDTTIPL